MSINYKIQDNNNNNSGGDLFFEDVSPQLLSNVNVSLSKNLNGTFSTNDPLIIDGKIPSNGDIILLNSQTDVSENGLYIVSDNGIASLSVVSQSVLDWSAEGWVSEALSQSYLIDGVNIDVNITNAVGMVPTAPGVGPLYQGDEASVEPTLISAFLLGTLQNNIVEYTFSFDTPVRDVSFKIFDADGELGTFFRQEQYIIEGFLDNKTILPSLQGGAFVRTCGNQAIGIDNASTTGAGSEDGVLTINFNETIDSFKINFKIRDGSILNPTSTPGFGIYNIFFTRIAEVFNQSTLIKRFYNSPNPLFVQNGVTNKGLSFKFNGFEFQPLIVNSTMPQTTPAIPTPIIHNTITNITEADTNVSRIIDSLNETNDILCKLIIALKENNLLKD